MYTLQTVLNAKLPAGKLLGHLQFWNLFFQFELASVTQFAAHQENKRLIGFVVCVSESPAEDSLSTYVFESNTEGEKVWRRVCCII